MVKAKQVMFSLILPIGVAIIIPIILLLLVDQKDCAMLINPNHVLLFLGISLLIFSLLLFIDCNIIFIKIGKGTLMPLKSLETQELIIAGPYKYVRNPMIIAVLLLVLSEALILNSLSILIWAGIAFVINIIYMPLSEEKGLEKRFGETYLHYKRNVRGWIPKLKPFKLESKKE